jgi:hypothetical protein
MALTRLVLASATIGVVTSGVAMVYFVFLAYFDWMRRLHLPPFRQQLWAFLHFPVHLAMVLFLEGSTQFVVWWKILEVETDLSNTLSGVFDLVDTQMITTTAQVMERLNSTVISFLTLYPPVYTDTITAVENALANLSSIPDSLWTQQYDSIDDPRLANLTADLTTLWASLDNVLLTRFNIDLTEEAAEEGLDTSDLGFFESTINRRSWTRFNLVVGTPSTNYFSSDSKFADRQRSFNMLSPRQAYA